MSSSPLSGKLQVVLVMPCLNEADNLKQTCLSLGFGRDSEHLSEHTALVIIDNGSTDATAEVAEEIRRSSKPDTVHLIQEPERGFVPAPNAGNLCPRRLANSLGWNEAGGLVLQGDG